MLTTHLRFVGRAQSEAIRQFEFVTEFRSLQMLAQVRQSLLKRKNRSSYRFRVCVCDIAPHGIWAGSQPRHLAQSPSADAAQVFVVGKLLFKQCAQRGRDVLWKMTDPGTQLIVSIRIKLQHAAPELLHPRPPFNAAGTRFR